MTGIKYLNINKKSLPKGEIITDKSIYTIYKAVINLSGNKCHIIKPGEKSKSIENYYKISLNLNNPTTLIAFGGGVVGDLTGFISSTYKRGINLIQIPTTLLAMVDSSIGGKNGINLSDKKNYLGTIYQPKEILIDIRFLNTLPKKEFINGVAEIIKYGAIKDDSLLDRLKKPLINSDKDLLDIIKKSIKIKTEIVHEDEKDNNVRKLLNFGHTIGHALEIPNNLTHGEAIAIGMVYESKLALEKNLISKEKVNKIFKALKANNLPTELPKTFNLEKTIELMKEDKKGPLSFSINFKSKNPAIIIKEVEARKLFLAQ